MIGAKVKLYPTERLKCWDWAKELRHKYYQAVIKARESGGILSSGSAGAPYALIGGFGRDAIFLTGEPYGATVAFHNDFAVKAEEAVEKAGIARDLCAYLRNYWGSILLDRFILPDGTVISKFPKPDFFFTEHLCCSHAKWYQYASELLGDVPLIGVDWGGKAGILLTESVVDYWVEQLSEAIERIEKVTGRKFDDELFIEAVDNELTSMSLWSEIYSYNAAIPAPLDEKSMFSLYVFGVLCPHWKEVVDLYRAIRDEVKDRVERGIAALATERYRITGDSQPPWGFLGLYRFLESYGVVSIGSFYTMCLSSAWDRAEDGRLIPMKTLREEGIKPKNRQEALRVYAKHKLRGHVLVYGWISCHLKSEFMLQFVRQWKADGVMLHLNRGCEGAALGQMENRLALIEAGYPVVTYEGNMADNRDFDYARTMARIETFLESQGLKKLS